MLLSGRTMISPLTHAQLGQPRIAEGANWQCLQVAQIVRTVIRLWKGSVQQWPPIQTQLLSHMRPSCCASADTSEHSRQQLPDIYWQVLAAPPAWLSRAVGSCSKACSLRRVSVSTLTACHKLCLLQQRNYSGGGLKGVALFAEEAHRQLNGGQAYDSAHKAIAERMPRTPHLPKRQAG